MSDSGRGFGIDLYHLDRVAKHDLPTVSSVYGDAIGNCQSAENTLHGMPAVPAQFNGDKGSVYHAYGELHGAITEVLKSTRTSLDETAQALSDSVKLYQDNDRAAAARFKELLEDRGKHKPEPTS